MKKVFISGSISIRELPEKVKESLNKINQKNYCVLIGDAQGIDNEVQKYLKKINHKSAIVYHITEQPRCFQKEFATKKINYKNLEEYKKLDEKEKEKIEKFDGRSRQKFKDKAMLKDSDFLLAIWDGKSQGTKNNILFGLEKDKFIKIFYLFDEENNKKIQCLNYNNNDDKEIFKKQIEDIFEENIGIGIRELQGRLKNIINEEDRPSDKLLKQKKYEKLKKIYKCSKDYIKEKYNEYAIKNQYKGKEKPDTYKPSLLEYLKEDYLEEKRKNQQDELFFVDTFSSI